MGEKKRFWSRYGWLYSLLSLIIALLMAIYHSRDTVRGLIGKMTSDIINIVVMGILFIGILISSIGWIRQLLRAAKSKYDNLEKLTELPPEDNIITIEPAGYPEVPTSKNRVIPELQFLFDVHNHSYYHFTPKRVELKCSNSGKEVVEDVWDWDTDNPHYISARKHITIDHSLPKYQARSVIFKVPIKNTYPDWYNWAFDGYVTYTNGEEERNVKIDDIRHYLSDKNIHKLEEMLKKVEGDEK
jgi:hypothetical protein